MSATGFADGAQERMWMDDGRRLRGRLGFGRIPVHNSLAVFEWNSFGLSGVVAISTDCCDGASRLLRFGGVGLHIQRQGYA